MSLILLICQSLQADLQVHYKNPSGIDFWKNWQIDLKICMEIQETQMTKAWKNWGLILFYLKFITNLQQSRQYSTGIKIDTSINGIKWKVQKIKWKVQKNCIYCEFNVCKNAKIIQCGKSSECNKWWWVNWMSTYKRMK